MKVKNKKQKKNTGFYQEQDDKASYTVASGVLPLSK